MSSKDSGGHGGSQSSSTPDGSSSKSGSNHWYISEIQQMMYGFGDTRKPLHESATLVEDIVRQQMTSMLYQSLDIASARNGRFIGLEDLLFLLRKDKVKLKRFLQYMKLKDNKAAALKGVGLDEAEEGTDTGEKVVQPLKKRQKICHDFLSSIDATGELTTLFDDDSIDEIKYERLLRAEVQSRGMDLKQYYEFCEARQISFGRKYSKVYVHRFRDWLLTGVNIDLKPNQHALEVFSYFAYETVAQIVDLALIVKQDISAGTTNDPAMKNYPSVCINYYDQMSPAGSHVVGRSPANPGMTSPSQSPPTTPTSGGINLGSSSSSNSSSSSKSKNKKRKKSGYGGSTDLITSQSIQPSDVQEAMRRYSQYVGPFASQNKTNPLFMPWMRLLSM